ncbi:hypothetical protein [Okeania sp.]|uniref:hypothetical protein n=1 Tax=Okeania sp. TaxID=3100323 RepID=UPI002B4B73C8|nr:hypothetical protein [Okeania sp.]MEB3341421.1 hypothetical protein [Okeania sp.]
MTIYLGRDLLADWGVVPQPNDKEEFTVSDYIRKSTKTILSSKDVPEWLQDAFIEGGENYYDVFRDELTNRGGIIDERRMNIQYT